VTNKLKIHSVVRVPLVEVIHLAVARDLQASKASLISSEEANNRRVVLPLVIFSMSLKRCLEANKVVDVQRRSLKDKTL